MAYSQGIDFRSTAGFVTDPSGCDAEIGTTANYPRTTAQGNTVGWEQAPGGTRNRSSTVDARLAGIAFVANGTTKDYRFDLPASGWYKITVALGDTVSQVQSLIILDTTTVVSNVLLGVGSVAGEYYDAAGVQYTAANWPANNYSIVANFSTTIMRFRFGSFGSGNSSIAHIFVQDASAPTISFPIGVDFRQTSDFVTDPASASPEISTRANYPHINRQNLTVGWEQAPTGVNNRTSSIDARLAGNHNVLNTGTAKYRIDLPATGAYRIGLALGDATTNQVQTAATFDNTTNLGTIVSAAATSSDQFYDAAGNLHTSDSDWVSNETLITETFSSTIFRLQIGGAGSGSSTVAHIRLEQLVSGAKTQTAKARIQKTVTKTQTAKTRLQSTTTKSQTAKARIQRAVTKTQSAKARLQSTVTRTQTAKARVQRTLTKTQTSTAHISASSFTGTKTQTAIARIGTGPVTVPASAVLTLQADDPAIWPLAVGFAFLLLQGDAPALPAAQQVPSGVLGILADPANLPTGVFPTSGALTLRADAPNLPAGVSIPVSGVLALRGGTPAAVWPIAAPSGVLALRGDQPVAAPAQAVGGQMRIAGDLAGIFPLGSPSGVLKISADSPTIANASFLLFGSGILVLRTDVPIVTPLTPPSPPPSPPPLGSGISIAVVI